MLLFNFCHQLPPACFLTISKHLMLLFNYFIKSIRKRVVTISKHLMLLFNSGRHNSIVFCLVISKHLMLLFNINNIVSFDGLNIFQNISCYCLTNDFTSFFNGLFKKTTILCTFPLFFPSAPSIYCFSKKVHISAISNTFSGNHLVKFCTFKYQ